MTKRNLTHTLNAPDYKVHVPFLRKLKDSKCALWSEKYYILDYASLLLAQTRKHMLRLNRLRTSFINCFDFEVLFLILNLNFLKLGLIVCDIKY